MYYVVHICDFGMLRVKDLYNCVGYDDEEMMKLKIDIKKSIQRKCIDKKCLQGDHIKGNEVCIAINKLNSSKKDGVTGIMSDHIIHAKVVISNYLALLFTAMLWHGITPDNILKRRVVNHNVYMYGSRNIVIFCS